MTLPRWLRALVPTRAVDAVRSARALRRRVERLEVTVSQLVAERHAELRAPISQRERLRASELRVHSQNGEDGIVLGIFSEIGVTDRRFVEIGVETGRECNTANLSLNLGWSGLLVEGDAELAAEAARFYGTHPAVAGGQVVAAHGFADVGNVNTLISRHGFRGELDLLSIDVDGNDYWLWEALEVIDPRVVVIEYNASLGLDGARVVRYEPTFRRKEKHPSGWYHGASLPALAKLASRKGYVLVGCDSLGVNAFFVRADAARGHFEALAPEEAFYPIAGRTAKCSQEAQWALIAHLPYEAV